MINRFRTRCLTCGHPNTLRITLGTDVRQEHTFACVGCGETSRVALNIDFRNRRQLLPGLPEFSTPTVEFICLENCEESTEEGSITNLDSTFLVPEHLLHKDQVFPWMVESRRFAQLDDFEDSDRKRVDIIQVIGGQRNLREVLATFCKATNLYSRQKPLLGEQQLKTLQGLLGAPYTPSLAQASVFVAMCFLGKTRKEEIPLLIREVRVCKQSAPTEYQRFRHEFLCERHADTLASHVSLLEEYLRGYEQFVQLWMYAAHGIEADSPSVPSSRDLQKVKMFYGNAFEELSAGLVLPACLNNIKNGRPYDAFAEMDLKKYLTINKANRPTPFQGNVEFAPLHDEFDSTIRNASHHGAIRLSKNSAHHIEYRSGDTGGWKTMPYAIYLLKCNRIMHCLMRLFALRTLVVEDVL